MNMTSNPAAGRRVAVIGLGRMGLRHLEAVRRAGMDICGVADVAEPARAAAREQFGLSADACFDDGETMLRSLRPEAIVIATTAPIHAPLTIAAAGAGAEHILCEKPMATSLAEADEMIAACNAAGAKLAINHQMRFLEQYTKVKEMIGREELGPLVSVVVAASNFGLAMNGCHYFEMFRYVSGRDLATVQAWFDEAQLANPRGAQFEDRSGRLLARSDDGRSFYLDFSVEAGNGIQDIFICRNGQILVDELNGEMRVVSRKAEIRDWPTTRYGGPVDIRVEKIQPADVIGPTADLWSAMLAGRSYPDGEAGLHALSCCVAAHVSHEDGGRAVRIDDPALPRARRFKWA
jgi:predicted dehydrogenase